MRYRENSTREEQSIEVSFRPFQKIPSKRSKSPSAIKSLAALSSWCPRSSRRRSRDLSGTYDPGGRGALRTKLNFARPAIRSLFSIWYRLSLRYFLFSLGIFSWYRLVLRCINTDFRNQILIFQHFSRSTVAPIGRKKGASTFLPPKKKIHLVESHRLA